MSRRAYNELYSSKYGHWEDASRINDDNYDFGNGDMQLQEVEIYSKWVWTSVNQFGMGHNAPNGGGNWANGVGAWTSIAGISISAAQGTIQTTKIGSDIAYLISGNSVLLNSVAKGFEIAPYIGLTATILTGSYLSSEINPATNQPYQLWVETGTDIGANIGIIYLGTQYGGWVGAGSALLYITDKVAFKAYINTVREHPDWALPPSVTPFTH